MEYQKLKSKKKYSYLVELKTIDATLFIYEPELSPNNKLYYDLIKNKFKGQVYLIGDALEIGDLDHAVKTGFFVGNNIQPDFKFGKIKTNRNRFVIFIY